MSKDGSGLPAYPIFVYPVPLSMTATFVLKSIKDIIKYWIRLLAIRQILNYLNCEFDFRVDVIINERKKYKLTNQLEWFFHSL